MPRFRHSTRAAIQSASTYLSPGLKKKLGRVGLVRRVNQWSKWKDQTISEDPIPTTEDQDIVLDPVEVEDTPEINPIALMGERPSYRYKLEESKRRRQLILDNYGIRDPLFAINDKYRAYEFADLHGIDHPKVYSAWSTIDEVDWTALPDAFVLKTRWGSSNTGVKALVNQGDGEYYDLMRSRNWTVDQILADHIDKESRVRVSRSGFVEELILKGKDEIADDWKFYCFHGKAGLSMQRDLRGSADMSDWRFKFRDRDWNDLGSIKFVDRLDPGLKPPNEPQALLDLAEHLSALIKRPFIRIDLFESERGPLLGEFTPAPGPPEVFAPEIDQMLGEFWEDAEAREFADSINEGEWDHLVV